MNDKTSDSIDDDMQSEYDFSGGVRGKHARAYRQGVTVTVQMADGTSEERLYELPEGAIVLDPDIRPYFPNANAVNRALRGLIELIPGDRSDKKIMAEHERG